MILRAITGVRTPACLFAAFDPVETVTPPTCGATTRIRPLVATSILPLFALPQPYGCSASPATTPLNL